MQNNYPNNDDPGDHHMGFALPDRRHHTNPVFKQSDFDTSGGSKNFGAFPVPDSTIVTVHPGSPPFTAPDSTPLTVNNESAWLDVKLDQLKPDEHGEYLEPNGEKIYREKVKLTEDTLHFDDGINRIDMILTYPDKYARNNSSEGEHTTGSLLERGLSVGDSEQEVSHRLHEREYFEKNLRDAGLKTETETQVKKTEQGETVHFLKISAPWRVLTKYAEILKFRMPIKIDDEQEQGDKPFDDLTVCCGGYCRMPKNMDYDKTLIPEEPDFFTAPYTRNKTEKFLGKDRDRFFSSAQRTLIVDHILRKTPYWKGKTEHSKTGVEALLNKGVYTAAYPMHDGRFDQVPEHGAPSQRKVLYQEWARWSKMLCNQPISTIKHYFGDKIGLYFVFLGFYTKMLIFPSIIGIVSFLYGVITAGSSEYNQPTIEICDESGPGNTTMCPRCEVYCPYWKLSDSCRLSYVTYVTDNYATIAFSIMMAFWAVIFMELWKRKQKVIAWEWDLESFEEEEQAMPQFEAKVKTTSWNPVTKREEPNLGTKAKVGRVVGAYSVVILMLFVVLAVVIAVMLYRLAILPLVANAVEKSGIHTTQSSTVTSLVITTTATMINLICILILNQIYIYIAVWLTDLECQRTFTEYEDSYTFKMFLFQFINYYSSLFYIAFVKGKLYSNPLDNSTRGKGFFYQFKSDECDPAGCFYELTFSLAIIMVGKQFLNNFVELALPYTMKWWRKRKETEEENGEDHESRHRWQRDYILGEFDKFGLLHEYLELAIQYGFITLFVASFPLAPLFALINNVLEIRLDANKFLVALRRPLARRAEDIGAWTGIFQMLTFLAVVTNGWTIAMSSDFINHMVYKNFASPNNTLDGYMLETLSVFQTSDWLRDKSTWQLDDNGNPKWPGPEDPGEAVGHQNQTQCYFKGIRKDEYPYDYKPEWWHVFAAKMAFVLVFQHVIFFISGIIMAAIPDVPKDVRIQIYRENELEKEILFDDDEFVKDNDMLGYKESTRENRGQEDNTRYRGHDHANSPL